MLFKGTPGGFEMTNNKKVMVMKSLLTDYNELCN